MDCMKSYRIRGGIGVTVDKKKVLQVNFCNLIFGLPQVPLNTIFQLNVYGWTPVFRLQYHYRSLFPNLWLSELLTLVVKLYSCFLLTLSLVHSVDAITFNEIHMVTSTYLCQEKSVNCWINNLAFHKGHKLATAGSCTWYNVHVIKLGCYPYASGIKGIDS